MEIIISVVLVLYVIYLVYEKYCNDKYVKSFSYIIHVNGIRGKTSVCRYIDAALRQHGYKVYTKTTGSTAYTIDTNNVEKMIKRLGPANIKEQLKTIKTAYKEKAEIVILECMAVNPEYQEFSQKHMVFANISVITNVKYDHVLDMGESLEEIAQALSGVIPNNGVLFTAEKKAEDYFGKICESRNTKLVLCQPEKDNDFSEYNKEIARRIALHITGKEKVTYDFDGYKEDFGAFKLYENFNGNNSDLLNLFSANDPQSTKELIEQALASTEKKYDNICYLYNNRGDRSDRLYLFAKHFFTPEMTEEIIFTGENTRLGITLLNKANMKNVRENKSLKELKDIKPNTLVVGMGNIKGRAYEILQKLEGGKIIE